MNEMVERVARAMYEKRAVNRDMHTWEDAQPAYREAWLESAQIAIEAMRVPTEGMVNAMSDLDFTRAGNDETNSDFCLYDNDARAVWQAMIDGALK